MGNATCSEAKSRNQEIKGQKNKINLLEQKIKEQENKINELIELNRIEREKNEKMKEKRKEIDFKENQFKNEVKNLEESKINFINIDGASCYQSSTLQGFVHVIYPIAIKKSNKERERKGENKIINLDELKNDNILNNIIIDILKEINNKENQKRTYNNKGDKRFRASDLFNKFPPEHGKHQGLLNEYDCNKLHENLFNGVTSNNIKDDSAKIIEIKKINFITEILKIKIEGNIYYHGNIVLKLNENDLNDNNLNIFKLLKNCPQLKKDSYSHKKITDISEVIYIIIDRINNNKTISKKFIINEKIYFDKNEKNFKEYCSVNYSLYELKFVIYHSSNSLSSGHYVAYEKINEEWFNFNDMHSDYAIKEKPPLDDFNENSNFPVIIYYVLDENNI